MCTIAVCDKRKLTDDELNKCFRSDSDGAGFAYPRDGKVYYAKGFMTVDELRQWYGIIPKDTPHVVHFRTHTSGGKSADLTHPYLVSKTSPLRQSGVTSHKVLFHNGVVSNWKELMVSFYAAKGRKIPTGPWSDTRFAAVLLEHLGEEVFSLLTGRWVTVAKTGEIHLYGDYTRSNGVLFSNMAHAYCYKSYKSKLYSSEYWRTYDWERERERENGRSFPTAASKAGMGFVPRTGDAD